MLRAVICKGDPTSHGGKVLEGCDCMNFEGRAVSGKGHLVSCPLCQGNFAIAEGVGQHTAFGVDTAVEGMKTTCGATLIPTTTRGRMMLDMAPGEAALRGSDDEQKAAGSHSGRFRAIDAETHSPIARYHYSIALSDGTVVAVGLTDEGGYTATVTTSEAETATVVWG